jgi:hypothetical protein
MTTLCRIKANESLKRKNFLVPHAIVCYPQLQAFIQPQPTREMPVVTYNDSYNNGNPNIFNGTIGNTWTLGAGLDWVTGQSNETLAYYGGLSESPYGNIINFSGTGNTITLNGDNTDLWISSVATSNHITTIVGEANNNQIYAAEFSNTTTPAGPTTIDLSATNLVNITAINGNDYGDTIRGNGQYLAGTTNPIPIYGGAGNDTFYESGSDTLSEQYGADQIDGHGGFNIEPV